MKPKTVGYARVSRQEQAEGQSLEQQVARLLNAGCDEVIEEIASGRKDTRVEYSRLIKACRMGEVHCVVATRLDRISRNLKTAIGFVELLDSLGVELKLLDDSFNFATAGGKLHAGMLSLLAQFESDRLEERIKHGWQHLRDTARAINAPFGFIIKDNKFHLDNKPFLCLLEDKSELSKADISRDILKTFFIERSLHATLKVINAKYGIQKFKGSRRGLRGIFQFSPAGLSDWLRSPVLEGHTCYLRVKDGKRQPRDKWEIIYNTHPDQTLIDVGQAGAIEAILNENRTERKSPFPSRKSALSGLVYCAKCRSSCELHSGQRGKTPGYNYYYQCNHATVNACDNRKMVRIEKIEQAVINALVRYKNAVPALKGIEKVKQNPYHLKRTKLGKDLDFLIAMNSDNPAIQNTIRQIIAQIHEIDAIMSFKDSEALGVDQFLELIEQLKINPNPDDPFTFTIDCKHVLHRIVSSIFIEGGTVKDVNLNFIWEPADEGWVPSETNPLAPVKPYF
jgi:DNA invertase Pin-like site-specific DNA recombinase